MKRVVTVVVMILCLGIGESCFVPIHETFPFR